MVQQLSEKFKKMKDYKVATIIASLSVGVIVAGLLFLRLRRLLLAFIIGSSVASTIFSLSYLGLANLQFKGVDNYEYMAVYVPLLYGAFNVLGSGLTKYFNKLKYAPIIIPALVGGMHGLVFSVIGRYLMGNLPVKNFQFNLGDEWQVHIYAFLYYSAVYGVVLTFLNQLYFIY